MPYHEANKNPNDAVREEKSEISAELMGKVLWILVPVIIGGCVSMFSSLRWDIQLILWGLLFVIVAFGLWAHNSKKLRRKRDTMEKERWQHLTDGLDQSFEKIDHRFDELDRRFDESDKTDKMLLRNELVAAHRRWVEECGYITLEALEYITELYEEYAAKGGNGSGEKLYLDIKALPINEKGVDRK